MLEDDIPDLLPELRPYQRRAAYWMVQQEMGDSERSNDTKRSQFLSPLSVPVNFIDSQSTMFYNPLRYDCLFKTLFSHLFVRYLCISFGLMGKLV